MQQEASLPGSSSADCKIIEANEASRLEQDKLTTLILQSFASSHLSLQRKAQFVAHYMEEAFGRHWQVLMVKSGRASAKIGKAIAAADGKFMAVEFSNATILAWATPLS